jgi:hypothetical protein
MTSLSHHTQPGFLFFLTASIILLTPSWLYTECVCFWTYVDGECQDKVQRWVGCIRASTPFIHPCLHELTLGMSCVLSSEKDVKNPL